MIVIEWWENFWDKLLEAWFKTYSGLGNYPDDRRVKREPK